MSAFLALSGAVLDLDNCCKAATAFAAPPTAAEPSTAGFLGETRGDDAEATRAALPLDVVDVGIGESGRSVVI